MSFRDYGMIILIFAEVFGKLGEYSLHLCWV